MYLFDSSTQRRHESGAIPSFIGHLVNIDMSSNKKGKGKYKGKGRKPKGGTPNGGTPNGGTPQPTPTQPPHSTVNANPAGHTKTAPITSGGAVEKPTMFKKLAHTLWTGGTKRKVGTVLGGTAIAVGGYHAYRSLSGRT